MDGEGSVQKGRYINKLRLQLWAPAATALEATERTTSVMSRRLTVPVATLTGTETWPATAHTAFQLMKLEAVVLINDHDGGVTEQRIERCEWGSGGVDQRGLRAGALQGRYECVSQRRPLPCLAFACALSPSASNPHGLHATFHTLFISSSSHSDTTAIPPPPATPTCSRLPAG